MKYTALGMTTFLNTATERMQEDSEDIKAFCDFLTAITAREQFFVQYSFEPNTLITDAPVWSFEVINKDLGLKTRFYVSLVSDMEMTQKLVEDPYYMDISTWLPADMISRLDCAIENTLIDPVTQKETSVQIIDNPLGFYTDPCRPLTWLVTEHALRGKPLTIQEVTLELFSIWEFAYLNPQGPPEEKEPDTKKSPQVKSAGHLRLVTLDGKLVDHS